jgi:hypothetical protein
LEIEISLVPLFESFFGHGILPIGCHLGVFREMPSADYWIVCWPEAAWQYLQVAVRSIWSLASHSIRGNTSNW